MLATSVTSLTRPLAVPDLADDGHVRGHAQEARHEASQVDLAPIGAGGAGLHAGHVRKGGHGRDAHAQRATTQGPKRW
jgi:hypothetical protein